MRFLTFILMMGACLAPPALEAGTIYVNPDGTGDATTIAQGISMAASGDTVLVACGTYYESELTLPPGADGYEFTLRSETGDPSCVTINGQGESFVLGTAECFARIEGFTITGGRAPAEMPVGGGLLAFSAMLTVSNCNFVGNEASAEEGAGGAVFLWDCLARFERCDFSENLGYMGGAMACLAPAEVELQDCEFRRNKGYAGGALYAGEAFFLGAGADARAGRTPAWLRGGGRGIGVKGLKGRISAPAVTTGPLWLKMGDCGLFENRAYGGGGFCFLSSGEAQCLLDRCALAKNEAEMGAGGYIWEGSCILRHCTLAENRSFYKGSVVVGFAEVQLENTIIALNGPAQAVELVDEYNLEIACCDIWGNQGGDWVGPLNEWYGEDGNICAPPIFCYAPAHRYFLARNSPCLAAGECGQIGAFGMGCPGRRRETADGFPQAALGAPSNPDEGIPSTWGLVKQIFASP